MNVLVVDDEPRVAGLLCEMVREMGHQCVSTGSAESATGAASLGEFSLAIVDINLGHGIDGISLARILKRDHHIPTVLVSGYRTPGMDNLIEENAIGFLPKPFTSSDLRTLLIDIYARMARGAS